LYIPSPLDEINTVLSNLKDGEIAIENNMDLLSKPHTICFQLNPRSVDFSNLLRITTNEVLS
jgi:hypothetical protein